MAVLVNAELVERLRVWLYQRGKNVSAGQVGAALVLVDMDDLRTQAENRVTWELWDKQSPINGASAEYVKSRSDYTDGAVFLVSIDARVVVMQPHVPGVEGHVSMSEEQARTLAEQMRGAFIEDDYFQSLAVAVGEAL